MPISALQHVALEPLLPVTERYNIQIHGGVLSAEGHLEYTAEGETEANLEDARPLSMPGGLCSHSRNDRKEAQAGQAVSEDRQEAPEQSGDLIRIDHGAIKNSEFGFVNQAAEPPYRVFLTQRGASC